MNCLSPVGYERLQGKAITSVLSSIIASWFFEQLRTEEQLGYAVFAFQASMGEQSGLGFYCKVMQNHQFISMSAIMHFINKLMIA